MLLHTHVRNEYAEGKCEDYDICPTDGTSGIENYGPGRFASKVQRCTPDKTNDAAMGVYQSRGDGDIPSGIRGGMPFRYVMPKFVCFSYPAGIDHFDITLSVRAPPFRHRQPTLSPNLY